MQAEQLIELINNEEIINIEESEDLIDLYTLLKVGKSDLNTEFKPKNLEYLKKGFEIRQD